jgi:hypothetical protein
MKSFVLLTLAAASLMAQGSLEIIGAYYGMDARFADVADRLRPMVQNGASLSVRVLPSSFGGLDPARGVAKVLRVYYRLNGQFANGEWRDGETAQIGSGGFGGGNDPFGGGGGGGRRQLRIVRAIYGAGNRTIDVTSLVQNQVTNNGIDLQITNANMGGTDPAPAVVKELRLSYEFRGRTQEVRVRENDFLRLPEGTGPISSGLRIISATYGIGNRTADVTGTLASLVSNDRITLTVSNATMGIDPARGGDKQLQVIYEFNGRRFETRVDEGKLLNIPGMGAPIGQR